MEKFSNTAFFRQILLQIFQHQDLRIDVIELLLKIRGTRLQYCKAIFCKESSIMSSKFPEFGLFILVLDRACCYAVTTLEIDLMTNLQSVTNWSIMADFQTSRRCYSSKIQWMSFKLHKTLATRYTVKKGQLAQLKLLFVGGRGSYSQIHLVGQTRQLSLLKQHTSFGIRSTNSLFVTSTILNVKIQTTL